MSSAVTGFFQRVLGRLLVIGVVVAGIAAYNYYNPSASPPPEDRVVQVADNDVAMTSAIEDAKASLPLFWREFDRLGGNSASLLNSDLFSLKVALPTPGGSVENIWTSGIRRDGDQIRGTIANDPENLPDVRLGQEVDINPEAIVDWSIQTTGGTLGHYTTRALLPHLTPDEAAGVRAILAPTPVPAEWTQDASGDATAQSSAED